MPPSPNWGLRKQGCVSLRGPMTLAVGQRLGGVPDAPTCCGRSASAPRNPCAGCAAAAPAAPPPGGVPVGGPARPGGAGGPPHFQGCGAESWLQERQPAEPWCMVTRPGVCPSLPHAVLASGGFTGTGILSPAGRRERGACEGEGAAQGDRAGLDPLSQAYPPSHVVLG